MGGNTHFSLEKLSYFFILMINKKAEVFID